MSFGKGITRLVARALIIRDMKLIVMPLTCNRAVVDEKHMLVGSGKVGHMLSNLSIK